MRTLAPDERTALQDALTRLLADHGTEAHVRATMDTASGYDPALWTQLAAMGIAGLLVDERHGGAGAGPVEIECVMEVAGARLLCAPLLASSVLAVGTLQATDDADAQARLLPDIASGRCIASVALTGSRGCWTADGVDVVATPAEGAWSLEGRSDYVLHGQNANLLLVVANTSIGLSLFEVDPAAIGVSVAPLPTFDLTLRLAQVRFERAPGRLVGTAGTAWAAVEAGLELALVALAGEQVGIARHTLDMTVEYARTRVQFGRAIGSFQAIKHMAADLLLEAESATSAARHAAASLADGTQDCRAAISLAAFACADACSTVTATAVQMHGGIAFTWEHPAHLYLRRARAAAQLLGSPAQHRERYLQHLGA